MANPRTIRESLATRLKSISGLTIHDSWPNSVPNVPCAIIDEIDAEPLQTFGRGDMTRWSMDVWVLTTFAPGVEQAIDNTDPYFATSSTGGIFGAIAADPTLGGAVHYTFVKGFRDFDTINVGESLTYQGAVASLEMWAT